VKCGADKLVRHVTIQIHPNRHYREGMAREAEIRIDLLFIRR